MTKTDVIRTVRRRRSNAGGGPKHAGFWRRLIRRPTAYVSIAFIAIVIFASYAAPLLAPYDPVKQDLKSALQLPSVTHWLGTDTYGRDVFSRLLYGGQQSFEGVVIALAVLAVVSIPLGLAAGYFRGWVDFIITKISEIVLALPNIIILLVVLSIFTGNMVVAMITFGLLGSAGLIRVIRGATIAVRDELYVDAARVSGLREGVILFRHILPRVLGPIIVQFSLFAGISLAVQTGLAYLGLGTPPPAPTWGLMIGEAAQKILTSPWLLVPPGVLVGLLILGFGLIGDAARDAMAEGQSRNTGKSVRKLARERAVLASEAESATPGRPIDLSTDVVLSVQGMSVQFEIDGARSTVVHEVGFEVRRGETVALVGESGSGKTVSSLAVLNLLPGNGFISAGHVYFREVDILTAGRHEMDALYGKRIAMVSQEPMAGLDPAYKIGNQLDELVRRHHGLKGKAVRGRTLQILRDVRLPDPEAVAGRYAHELSGGMAQRVVIAMALVGEPELLLADEPTTALDVTVQAEILELLRDLQRARGMAVLFVTHDLGVVADVCSRAVVMQEGRIVEQASVEDIFARPQHPYTQSLIDATPSLVPIPDRIEPIPAESGSRA